MINIVLSIPSFLALFITLWYGMIAVKSRQSFLVALCFGSITILVCEIIYFLANLGLSENLTYYLFITYYIGAVLCGSSYLGHSLSLSGHLNAFLKIGVVGLFLLNAALLIVPGVAIEGIKTISYGFTRIAGPFYWIIQLTLVSTIALGLILLFLTVRKAKDWEVKRKAILLIISSFVWVLTAIFIVLFMQLGYPINALVAVPIAICIFFGLQIYSVYEQRVFRLMSFVPDSSEQYLTKNTIRALLKYKSGDLQQAVSEFEKGIIEDMLKRCGDNKTLAAEKLGISRATLRRKLDNADG